MKQNFLKLGLALIAILTFSLGNAQQTTGDVGKTEDVGRSSTLDGTIRVIDNKGTKKFLQVKNGITLLTDATPDGGIVSTWQLGGTLTDDTFIDASGAVFALDGLELVDTTTDAPSTDATDGSTAATATGTGWTVLVRDEATGETKKLLATDIVAAGQLTATASADGTAPALADGSIPAIYQKVWVYRNGAKLVANVDYTVAAGVVTLVPSTTAPNDWEIFNGDVFEVQWIN
ncbi:hypothetical protein ACKGJY_03235 [Hyunsoonleella sp. 2307UL5-6]|uniref:hypothetical protein n=1 Tax=Hyunsoonleella sp. 2307UL5-6 TaxID=3384768 RepID=UPI0039BC4712